VATTDTAVRGRTPTKNALIAYLNALALAEPIQAKLWRVSGITMTQLAVLRRLRQGAEPMGRLGIEVGLAPASISRLVDRLEKGGLVARSRDGSDRRRVDVRLTSHGEKVLGEIHVFKGSNVHQAIESMTDEERGTLVAGLDRFVELARSFSVDEDESA
jgi:DNA-binding MarR family transcriptional regulator